MSSNLIFRCYSVALIHFLEITQCKVLSSLKVKKRRCLVHLYSDLSYYSEVSHCVPLSCCLCVFNQASRLHRIWPMTAQQTATLFSSHYKVSLSLFSSGNSSRDSIKVNDMASVCSISVGTGREYITLSKKGNWGLEGWFRTSLLCPHLHAVLPRGVKSHHRL